MSNVNMYDKVQTIEIADAVGYRWRVEYEVCRAEPDVGMPNDYVEIHSYEFLGDDGEAEYGLLDDLNDMLAYGEL